MASSTALSESTTDTPERMDRMYRWTRHVYDATRRYYLLGRDRLLEELLANLPADSSSEARSHEHRFQEHPANERPLPRVLEVGCGTARNLRRLHRRGPPAELYGLDASPEMLATAGRKLRRSGGSNVHLAQGLAQELDPVRQFDIRGGFDAIFFSYVLSMIPSGEDAVEASLEHLRPGGSIYIVDFWDQAGLPRWARDLLQGWLALFGVHHRPELLQYLHSLEAAGRAQVRVDSVARRYAYLARLTP